MGLQPRRIVLLIVVFSLVAALLWSLFGDAFIPESAVVTAGIVAAACCAVAGARFGWSRPISVRTAGYDWRNNRYVRVVAMALVASWAGFGVFAVGLPSLYTLALGTPGERHTIVSGWHSRGRRNCAGPYIPDASIFTTRLCWATRLADGTDLLLRGEQSALGFEVESFAPTP